MIRRKVLSRRQQQSLDYKRTAPIAIAETRDAAAVRQRLLEAQTITAVRQIVFATRFSCQLCRGARTAECAGLPDEMHEDPPRSKTRGLPPEVRFNARVCARLCHACHADVTEHRLRIVFLDPVRGFLGPVRAEPV
jgi:hypothetical protein